MKIPDSMAGQRLDQALAELLPDYSRARIQEWIKAGHILLNAAPARPKDKVHGGEEVDFDLPRQVETHWQGQALPLNILYEDEDLIVVDKPAGQVVHPGAGTPDHTLVNALLHYEPRLETLPRAGIIHRLDKDTTGVLVIARRLSAHAPLVEQLQAREFEREYRAVVNGVMISGGTVDAPIGRHPHQRTRMAVVQHGGKPAVTEYRVGQRYRAHTLLKLKLETGRTHQIRVHMAHINHPIVGDPVYGGRLRLPAGCGEALRQELRGFKRQALHAARLGLVHPASGEFMAWESPLPADLLHLLEVLATDAATAAD